jgi:hypothetical protein
MLRNMSIGTKSIVLFALILFIIMTAMPAVEAQSAISEEKKKKMYHFDPAGAFSEGQEREKRGERKGRVRKDSPSVRSANSMEQLGSPTARQEQGSPSSIETASTPAPAAEAQPTITPGINTQATTSTEGRQITGLTLLIVFTLILAVLVAITVLIVKLLREYERLKAENGQDGSRNLASIAHK